MKLKGTEGAANLITLNATYASIKPSSVREAFRSRVASPFHQGFKFSRFSDDSSVLIRVVSMGKFLY